MEKIVIFIRKLSITTSKRTAVRLNPLSFCFIDNTYSRWCFFQWPSVPAAPA